MVKYQRCKYCNRNKVFNVTYSMCEDCLKEGAKKYNLDICNNCDGNGELCFCNPNGFMNKEGEFKT